MADKNVPPLIISLYITVPPEQPLIVGFADGAEVKVPHEEESLDMICLSVHGKPAADIKWFVL